MANTISQKRLNAYGATNCSNSVLQSRLQPAYTDTYVWPGDSLLLSVLNIDCALPNGTLDVLVDGGAEAITLSDDGVSPDLEANDGIYIGQRQWLASEIGDHTLAFPNNDIVTVHVIPPLSAYTFSTNVPFNYRTITGTELHLGDDDSAMIRPPFPVRFGGASFPTLHVNSNGNVTFFGPFAEWDNSALPTPAVAPLVAPFWDDLAGSVWWDVIGATPDRELVIEWRHALAMACMWSESPRDYATFQIVFSESSSDIVFNYASVQLGAYDPYDPWRGCGEEVNGGASATVGVQSIPGLANQFSFKTASLTDNSSILWQTGQLTPAITQLSPFSVLAGNPAFTLSVLGQSFVPGAIVRWNGRNLTTATVDGGELTADISASDVATAGSAQVTVFNPPPNGGSASSPAFFPVYSSYPTPTLTDITPNPAPLQLPIEAVTASTNFTLIGTDFVAGAIAHWDGIGLQTTPFSSTRLQARVTSNLMSTGTHQVTVINPAPGGGSSNMLQVSVVQPVPMLSPGWPFPKFVGVGAPAFTLQAMGSGFTPASVIRWNGSDRPTTFGSSVLLSAAIPASDVASLGTAEVTVFNPAPGGGTSDPVAVSIIPTPANDKFSNATAIPTYPFSLTQNTAGATADAMDPKPPCREYPPQPQESVWFTLSALASGGFITVDTLGSTYDDDISVWTGSPGNLVNLGCTFNYGGNYMLWPLVFPASSSPMHLMVSSLSMGTAGTLKLSLNAGPGFSLASTPATSTVSRGTTATYNLTVTPVGGSFDYPVALSCSVQPVGPNCLLSQISVTPGNAAASITLRVDTSGVAHAHNRDTLGWFFAFWLAFPILGVIAGSGFEQRPKKIKLGMFVAVVLALVVLGMPGCGGGQGGEGGGGGGGHQTLNYTVTVTGTSSGITQTTSVSLAVTF